jgi:arylsulfatase A-like enzyme
VIEGEIEPEASDLPLSKARGASVELPGALLVGWLAIAVVSATALTLKSGKLGLSGQLLRYAFVVGHLLVIGCACALVARLFLRFVHRRRLLIGCISIAGAMFALGFVALDNDLSNFYSKREEAGSRVPWPYVAPLLVSVLVTATAYVGLKLARPRLRFVSIGSGLVIATFCQTSILKDYAGLLLVANVLAAVLLSTGLLGLRLPTRVLALRKLRLLERVAVAVALVAGLASLLVMPRPSVWRSLFEVPGSLLVPYLVVLRPDSHAGAKISGAWFSARDGLPSIPPSAPSLLPKNMIVIFITIDAMRGDLLASDDFAERLPNFTKLRRGGANFTMARAPSPATLTTLTSFYTGKYYSQIYWTLPKPNVPSAKDEPTKFLAELLQERGVRTVQVAVLRGAWTRGGARGFDKVIKAKKYFAPAKDGMDLILKELRRDDSGPLFIYSHFADPHHPYTAGKASDSPFDRYLAEVKSVDAQVGRLYRFLKKQKLLDRTLLAFSADHGEAFGEHGGYLHAWGNFDEVVRVPLLLHGPNVKTMSIATPVSVMDMRPTILDLFGVATPGTDMGQTLVPFLRGENPVLTRPIVVDAGRRIQSMVFPDNIKVTRHLTTRVVEVYDLDADPGEQHDLADDPRYGQGKYVDAIAAFFEAHTLKREGYETPWRKF